MSVVRRLLRRRSLRRDTRLVTEAAHLDKLQALDETIERQRVALDGLIARVDRLEAAATATPSPAATPPLRRRAAFYHRPGYLRRSVVIGLGTGRSGTVSLARLLDAQPDAAVGHEMRPLLPWHAEPARVEFRLWQLEHRSERLVGDVAYSYLPAVEQIAAALPDARFVCLRRNREEVVESMMKKTPRTNLWADHDGTEWEHDPVWDPTMPSYPPMPKRDAIGRYWDDYYRAAADLELALDGRFRVFDLNETLNTDAGVNLLLDFVGVPEDERVAHVGIVANETPTGRSDRAQAATESSRSAVRTSDGRPGSTST